MVRCFYPFARPPESLKKIGKSTPPIVRCRKQLNPTGFGKRPCVVILAIG